MKGLDYALLTCKEQHFCYFRAGEVVENRSVVRHFRLGGGAILMVLVVFQHFHTRGCCSKGSRQLHVMGPISKIRLNLRHFRERG